MGRAWPLIGRVAEQAELDAAMSPSSGYRGVVLAGAAGVGKTRLAHEYLAAARRRGRLVHGVTATSSARGLPLGAFVGAGAGTAGGDPLRVVRAAMNSLVQGAGPGGVVVGVDDAHLLDEQSAFLVHQLVLQGLADVVITVRTGQPAPDAVTALWKDGLLARVDLPTLSAEHTAQLLAAVVDGSVDDLSASRLWSLTGGNVLYLRHVLEEELRAARWRPIGGIWQWDLGPGTVSSSLSELITAHMGALSEPLGAVVDLLAVAEPLPVELLIELVAEREVEAAESLGLITIGPHGETVQARLAHPLYGEVRRARMGRLRGRRLRGQVAAALTGRAAARPESPEETVRRAVLTLESDLPSDPTVFADGARAAFALLDMGLSERLMDAAVRAGGGFPAKLGRAYVLSLLSRGREAEAVLAPLAALDVGDVGAVQVAALRAANLFFDRGLPAEAESVLARAAETLSDPAALAVLTPLRSVFSAMLGRGQEGIAAARTFLDLHLPLDRPVMLAHWGLVVGLGGLGRTDEADAAAVRGYELAARSMDVAFLRFGLCDFHLIALGLAGRIHQAQDVAGRLLRLAAEIPGQPQLFTAALMGQAASQAGDLRAAARWLGQALEGFTRTEEMGGWRFHTLITLAQVQAKTGDRTGATRSMDDLEKCRNPALRFLEPLVLIDRAWLAAADGVVSEAVEWTAAAARVAAAQDQPAYEVMALHTGVRFGDRTTAARIAALADIVDGPRAAIAAAHAAALAADDGAGMDEASQRLERMGDRLAAADAAAQGATCHTRHGRRGSAMAAAARARRLAAECDAAVTPALSEMLHPTPLTVREREIVTLAAQGLSNRAIADRLVVSVRTVEGHLYRASAKLGGTNRSDLARLLGVE